MSGLWSPRSERLRISTGQPANAATATEPARAEACMRASGSHAASHCSFAVSCLDKPCKEVHTARSRTAGSLLESAPPQFFLLNDQT